MFVDCRMTGVTCILLRNTCQADFFRTLWVLSLCMDGVVGGRDVKEAGGGR